MRLATHTIWIARSPQQVFDFFADLLQATRWRQYVESMQLVGEGAIRAGSRVRTVMNLLGERYTFELEVLAYEPPRLWRHRTFESDFTGYVEYRFDPENAGTRVTMTMEARPAGVYGWLALPLMWLRREKPYVEQLPRLKRALEEG